MSVAPEHVYASWFKDLKKKSDPRCEYASRPEAVDRWWLRSVRMDKVVHIQERERKSVRKDGQGFWRRLKGHTLN